MLQAGLVEPAQSEWASNVVLVRKSDGSMRFCVDYRPLNERTVKDSYPLSIMSAWMRLLARNGFQLLISDLVSPGGVGSARCREDHLCYPSWNFRIRVMPFGLCNAPATFQCLVNVVCWLGSDGMSRLLDDIIVHLPDLRVHLERLIWLFLRGSSGPVCN